MNKILSIIIPTYNEAENIKILIDKIQSINFKETYEIIVVDDNSPDKTWQSVEVIQKGSKNVRLLRRIGRRGLSSAVIEGILLSTADYFAVIDADLQHDETILTQMLSNALEGDDVVIGTRYSKSEDSGVGNWSKSRILISKTAALMSRLVMQHKITDPMSGLFLMKRSIATDVIDELSTSGFKILLDILSLYSKNSIKISEVAYIFKSRVHGESKLSSGIILEYLEFLHNKKFGKYISFDFVKFGMVGSLGVLVQYLMIIIFYLLSNIEYSTSLILAIAVATVFNYNLNNRWTFKDVKLEGNLAIKGFIKYAIIVGIGGSINYLVNIQLVSINIHWFIATAVGVLAGMFWNYLLNKVFTWNRGQI